VVVMLSVMLGTMTATAADGNLVRNPGFERDPDADGSPNSWSESERFTRSQLAQHDGNYSGLVTGASAGTDRIRITQQVHGIAAEQAYTLSGWFLTIPNKPGFRVELQIIWFDALAAPIATESVGSLSTFSGSWRELSGTVTAPADAATARIKALVVSFDGAVYLDDFSLVAQP
jgi:hypothetical protein